MTAEAFAPFGSLIDFNREPDFPINRGMCDRYHALGHCEAWGTDAKTIISLGRARSYDLPLRLEMVERHPFGSQAFIPLDARPFLVIVAPNKEGIPGEPLAFKTEAKQGINYHLGTWHGVLTPFGEGADFLIVDREGQEYNTEEYFFDKPYLVCEAV